MVPDGERRMDLRGGKKREEVTEHRRSSRPSVLLSQLHNHSHLSYLLDLRQAEAERRVDPREQLVAAHEVGAVGGGGHRVFVFFVRFFRRRRSSPTSNEERAQRALAPFSCFWGALWRGTSPARRRGKGVL